MSALACFAVLWVALAGWWAFRIWQMDRRKEPGPEAGCRLGMWMLAGGAFLLLFGLVLVVWWLFVQLF